MGYYSDLHAEGPYRTCGEADEARQFYPDEYRMAMQVRPQPTSQYTCLGCGDPLPRGRGGHCDACIEWSDAGPIVPPSEDEPGDPQPAPPIGTDFETWSE